MSDFSHVTVIANPTSRHGAGRRIAAQTAHALTARGVSFELLMGETSDATADLAGKAARTDTDALAVIGGDGTLRVVLEAAMGTGTPIGLIPAGSGNDTARNLGIPLDDVDGAIDIILAGRCRFLDLGRATFADGTTAVFATIAATGFDAAVAARAGEMSWPSGQSRYTVAALRQLPALNNHHYQVRVDDAELEEDVAFTAIANTTSYGGGLPIAPDARMDDGLFEITVALRPRHFARFAFARALARLRAGKRSDLPMVRTLRGREVELYGDPPAEVSLDGDLLGTLPAVFDVVPRATRILAPTAH